MPDNENSNDNQNKRGGVLFSPQGRTATGNSNLNELNKSRPIPEGISDRVGVVFSSTFSNTDQLFDAVAKGKIDTEAALSKIAGLLVTPDRLKPTISLSSSLKQQEQAPRLINGNTVKP